MKARLHGIISLGLMVAAVVVAAVAIFPRFGCGGVGAFIGFWVMTGIALIQIRGVAALSDEPLREPSDLLFCAVWITTWIS